MLEENSIFDSGIYDIKSEAEEKSASIIPKNEKDTVNFSESASEFHYLCKKCNSFPIIQFINNEYIRYSCNCKENKNIIISLNEIFNKSNNFLCNIKSTEFLYLSYESENNKEKEENIGLFCNIHKYKKFKYYCIKCNKNLCKKCCEEHPCSINDIKNFVFMSKEANRKMNIINKINDEFNINNNSKNYFKSNLNNSQSNDVNSIKEEINKSYFCEFIKIILDDFKLFPNYSHFINIDNIYFFLSRREMEIEYNYNDRLGIKLFGNQFVKNNKNKLFLVIDNKEYELKEYFRLPLEFTKKKKDSIPPKFPLIIKLFEKETINDMSYMFEGCENLISIKDISKWDTSNITNFSGLFKKCTSLKSLPDISKFDISKATDISQLFFDCHNLSSLPDISKWNTQNVKDISFIFLNCNSLKFLPDISKWNTNNVEKMNDLFSHCTSLKILPDISKWDTSNVIDMSGMFVYCDSLESFPDISKWNTSKVINISELFAHCISVNQLPEISNWNVSKVKKMSFLFENCISLRTLPDLSIWEMNFVEDISGIFKNCISLEFLPNLSKWTTINITNMNSVFYNCCSLNYLPDISKWDTFKVTDMSFMFYNCISLVQFPNISNWKNYSLIKSDEIFFNCLSISFLSEMNQYFLLLKLNKKEYLKNI